MNNRRWIIFGISVSLFLISLFYRVSSAIIAVDLSRDLNLKAQDLGLLGAAFFYSFALIQIPLGLILDRIGARMTMFVLNIIGIIGTIIFAQASGLAGGVIGRSLLGIGMAANLMGTLKLMTNWFDLRKFATLSGLALSLGTLGSLAATSPLALLVQTFGWRISFYLLAGLHASLTLCLFLFVSDMPSEKQAPDLTRPEGMPAKSALISMKTLFSSWSYWAISFSIFLRYGSFASIQALWAGPFLIVYLGLSPVSAGNLLLILSIGLIVGSPIGGMLSDQVFRSRKIIIITGTFITALATFALSRYQSPHLIFVLGFIFFLLGFFISFGQVSYAHIQELMPKEMSGTAMTGINFFVMMGAGVFIHGLGAFSNMFCRFTCSSSSLCHNP
jgi:nitrate/nitrite transporter NarK